MAPAQLGCRPRAGHRLAPHRRYVRQRYRQDLRRRNAESEHHLDCSDGREHAASDDRSWKRGTSGSTAVSWTRSRSTGLCCQQDVSRRTTQPRQPSIRQHRRSRSAPRLTEADNDTTPLFAGTAGTQPGDSSTVTVLVYDGNSATGTPAQTLTTTRAADGSYAVEPGAPLSEGTHTAQAEQRDTARNVGRSAARTFTVTTADITPPAVTLTTPPDGSSGTDATPLSAVRRARAPGDLPTVTVNVYAGVSPAGEPIQTLTTLAVAASWSVGGDSLPGGYLYRAGRAVGQRRESRPDLSARLHDRHELQGRHPGGRPGGVLAPGRVERNDSTRRQGHQQRDVPEWRDFRAARSPHRRHQ